MRLGCGILQLVRCHVSALAEHLPIHLHPQPCHARPPQPWAQAHLHSRSPVKILQERTPSTGKAQASAHWEHRLHREYSDPR